MKRTAFALFAAAALFMLAGCAPKDSGADASADSANVTADAGHDSSCPSCDHGDQASLAETPEAYKKVKPTLFASLTEQYYTPDGLTLNAETGKIYLNVPNFGRMDEKMLKADSHQGGYLLMVNDDGTFEKLLDYPVLEATGQCGPMGLDFGPDGNLYVCDNQYFHDKNAKSRILRVVMKDGKPTGEVQTAVEGVKLANAVLWHGDKMFYTDSCLDTEGPDSAFIGAGGLFMFTADEVLQAGVGENPPAKVNAAPDDAHCVAFVQVEKVGRGDNTGPDGLTVAGDTIYFGNFGNGSLYALYPDEKGEYKKENMNRVFDSVHQTPTDKGPFKGLKLECCDGIFYDAETNRVYLDDSQNNAIWAFAPVAKGEQVQPVTIWKNGDTDGNNGLLDQPCEAVVAGGKLIIANFDWPFPGLINSTVDPPGTLSAIDMKAIADLLTFFEESN